MKEASALLSSALDRAGLNARELSHRSGVAEGRISDYLSGRHDPGVARLAVMLVACGYELRLAPRRDGNGLVLAERLDEAGPLPQPEPPTWAELVPGRG
ncbi:MAG TPA: helix-turn-helix transcriptional regulator [Acidimicrobiales bacterium]|nr:helix-turn-helix transcriptional regulator [Acidimicrobiales bacterium]